jgi:hypothetical protein
VGDLADATAFYIDGLGSDVMSVAVEERDGGLLARDPSGIAVHVTAARSTADRRATAMSTNEATA